jgi:hypothetical protein
VAAVPRRGTAVAFLRREGAALVEDLVADFGVLRFDEPVCRIT